jgi:2'-5' RNA ligase
MRIFVGIELPEGVRAAAADAAERLRGRLSRETPALKLRWVDPSKLHLTLWFLGEVAEARAVQVREALAEPWRTRAFTLVLGGAGMFPLSGLPRVLWLGVRDGETGCRALHEELRGRLAPLGFAAERRPFAVHLTVARVKEARRSDLPTIRACLAEIDAPAASGTAGGVTLFRSRLSPAGSQYEPLLHVPLK